MDALDTIRTWVKYIREYERPDVLVVSYHGDSNVTWTRENLRSA